MCIVLINKCNFVARKTDDSGQDDDSISIVSNEADDEEETEQIKYSIFDKSLFGIRRRRTKIVEKPQIEHIETGQDALEDTQIHSNILEAINGSETVLPKTNDKFKYTLFVLIGITGCYLSYKYIPMYIVSFKSVTMIHIYFIDFLVHTKLVTILLNFPPLAQLLFSIINVQLEMYLPT